MRRAARKRTGAVLLAAFLFLGAGCALPQSHPDGDGPRTEDYRGTEEIYRLSEVDLGREGTDVQELFFAEDQTELWIRKGGSYLLKGAQEGGIRIDAQDEVVHLILQDVELKSYSGPAICVESAAKVVLTVPDESSSILMDSPNYAGFTDREACVYSACDLTVNGGGSLQVYGYYKDGIRTKDVLKLLDLDLSVQAKRTGLRGNDGVAVRTRALHIRCEGSGIYTEQKKRQGKGYADLAGGTVSVIAGKYGLDIAGDLYIHDCSVSVRGIVRDIRCGGIQYRQEGCAE